MKGAIVRQVLLADLNRLFSNQIAESLDKIFTANVPIVKTRKAAATYGVAANKHAVPERLKLSPIS